MKSYILLRNNKESGPYTLQEMKEFGLTYSDLVWIEGESTSWNHPSEIRGLKNLVSQGIKRPLPNHLQECLSPFSSSEKTQSAIGRTDNSFSLDSCHLLPTDLSDNSSAAYFEQIK